MWGDERGSIVAVPYGSVATVESPIFFNRTPECRRKCDLIMGGDRLIVGQILRGVVEVRVQKSRLVVVLFGEIQELDRQKVVLKRAIPSGDHFNWPVLVRGGDNMSAHVRGSRCERSMMVPSWSTLKLRSLMKVASPTYVNIPPETEARVKGVRLSTADR